MENKIAILLADSDALRRDGMVAVVQGTGAHCIVATCTDGAEALREIHSLQPEVAIVDLNLPRLHGIEVIRQVRAAGLKTKIIVVSGSEDDDIIREVVRAGGDGYLLKNSPARHLLDAIGYVRDGGQYFSPHLRRDGLDRHLLQERPAPFDTPGSLKESSRQLAHERLRDNIEAHKSEHLEDRDYEILSMMADGIRPILDRLDEIEGKVDGMETGLEPVPQDPGNWLSTQLADTLRSSGGKAEVAHVGRSVRELEARLPVLIEEAVSQRFHVMADRLQREIEESHIQTLETFVRNIQVKLVNRISALENDMSLQAENMNQLRESSQRTEDNLSRLISGVDKLAQELPNRLREAQVFQEQESSAAIAESSAGSGRELRKHRPGPATGAGNSRASSRSNSKAKIKAIWAAAAFVLLICGFWLGAGLLARHHGNDVVIADSRQTADATRPAMPPSNADTRTKMSAAEDFLRRKEYPVAEDLYRQVVKSDARNVDALKGLASVLYREEKIEESAQVLDKIPAQ